MKIVDFYASFAAGFLSSVASAILMSYWAILTPKARTLVCIGIGLFILLITLALSYGRRERVRRIVHGVKAGGDIDVRNVKVTHDSGSSLEVVRDIKSKKGSVTITDIDVDKG
jgi:hypothetical protein